jgi:hypothetical protein
LEKEECNVHQAIPRPLREECERSDNAHPSSVSHCLEQAGPSTISGYFTIELDGFFNFLELVFDQGIFTDNPGTINLYVPAWSK